MKRGINSNPCPEFMKNWQIFGVTDTNKKEAYCKHLRPHLKHEMQKTTIKQNVSFLISIQFIYHF